MFLLNKRIIFFLTSINFSITKDLVSWILFFYRLDLPLIHVIINIHFFFLEINQHFSYLLFHSYLLISLPLLSHLQYFHLVDMIIIIKVIFSSIDSIRLIFNKSNTSADHLIISIFIYLCCLFSYILYTLDQTVMISVWIVSYYPHSSVNFDHLLPVRQLSWTIILDCLKLIWVSISSL